MYVKSITLRGFLCFKDATTITFDPKFNVIIGPNGSGKSSLLSGLRVVMGEAFASDKERFLHRGASSRVLVGYITVVLDNSDGRLSGFDTGDLTLKREFGLKNDDFTLNGKKITKNDLRSLLESAGFSRTNPYYFIHQHEVTTLTKMSNAERLQLLKDVAGTKVYEERRTEASRSLKETRTRRKVIDDTLDIIIKRMDELNEEQQDLKKFLGLEKERRCIETLLSSKELEEIRTAIRTAEESKLRKAMKVADCTAELSALTESIESRETECRHADAELTTTSSSLVWATHDACVQLADEEEAKRLTSQQKDLRRKVADLEAEATRLQSMMKARKGESAKRKEEKALKETQLKKLETEVKNIRSDLKQLKPKLVEMEDAAREKDLALSRARQEFSQLQGKMNRKDQFSSVAERNHELSKQIWSREKDLKMFAKQKEDAEKKLNELDALSGNKSSKEVKADLEKTEAELKATSEEWVALSREVPKLADRRVQLQQKGVDLSRLYKDKDNDAYRASQTLTHTMRPGQRSANESARRWAVETNNQNLVFGTLLENIKVEPEFHVAIETAGGLQLFNYLVLNRQVAFQIVEYIKSVGEGSTTLVPLQDLAVLQDPLPSLPHGSDPGVRLLTDVIECSSQVEPAVKQVFGRFLLVPSRDVGQKYQGYGFDSITLTGDMISRQGIVRGGYQGNQKRMASQAQINLARREMDAIQRDEQSTATELKKVEKELDEMQSKIRNAEMEKERLRLKRNGLNDNLQQIERDRSKHDTRKSRFETQLKESQNQMELIKEDIQRIRREVSLPTLGELGVEESERLSELNRKIPELESQCEEKEKECKGFKRQVEGKECQLVDVLAPRIEQLQTELRKLNDQDEHVDATGDSAIADEELSVKQMQLSHQLNGAKAELAQTENRRTVSQEATATAKQTLRQSKAKQEVLKGKLEELESELRDLKSYLETQRCKHDALSGKEQAMAGSSELLSQLSKLTQTELTKRLASVAKKLRTFSEINRKASDQYSSFIDEQVQLTTQRQLLYQEEDSVVELMKSLDDQKDETLIKAFENVNSRFGQVFAEITSGGKAKLVLKKLAAEDIAQMNNVEEGALVEQQDGDHELHKPSPIDVLTGVSIKVQFPSFKSYIALECLSGGQKAVAALSLMFALQRVDSAPFYVLDEVDASLDAQYRGAVAKLIKRQSQLSQIIVISHRAQTISMADRFLKTCIVNQSTSVIPTTLDDAMQILQRLAIEIQENNKNAATRKNAPLVAGSLEG